MIVGIDFDNTIVCYDDAFHRAACEQGLIAPEFPASKEKVRDHLRSLGREDDWTGLQGYVYGARMHTVNAFAGAADCIKYLGDRDVQVYIISHKTIHPYRGTRYNLHDAARNWLATSGFLDKAGLGMDRVFFEVTKEDKLARIVAMQCTHFIDDLPEIFLFDGFPASTARMLFVPGKIRGETRNMLNFSSWEEIGAYLRGTDD